MDLIPIIPDLPDKQTEAFQSALGKLIRNNDHKILEARVQFQESVARLEITIQCDKELGEKITDVLATQPIEETPLLKSVRESAREDAARFIETLRTTQIRYQGDNPF